MTRCMECLRDILSDDDTRMRICNSCIKYLDGQFDEAWRGCSIEGCCNRATPKAWYARHIQDNLCQFHLPEYYTRAMLLIREWYGT